MDGFNPRHNGDAPAYVICQCGKPVHRKRVSILACTRGNCLGCSYCADKFARALQGETVAIRRFDPATKRRGLPYLYVN